MEYLIYDRMSDMLTLETEDDVIFLGPISLAALKLKKEFGYTQSQVDQAIGQAYSNCGSPVHMDVIRNIASS